MDKVLLFLGVVFNILAQLMLKHGMKEFGLLRGGGMSLLKAASLIVNPFVIGALVSYGTGFMLYSVVISRMELSRAYPVSSVAAILLLSIISIVFFHETLSGLKVAGISFCLLGILLVLY